MSVGPELPLGKGFVVEADRDRLSMVALKAFRRLVGEWKLTREQAAALLGVSVSTWDRLRAEDKDKSLSQDQMTRISALVGIYEGLHLLFADEMADRWPTLPNRAPLFARATPLDSMIEGGIPQMLGTRRYINAARGA